METETTKPVPSPESKPAPVEAPKRVEPEAKAAAAKAVPQKHRFKFSAANHAGNMISREYEIAGETRLLAEIEAKALFKADLEASVQTEEAVAGEGEI